MEIERLDLDAAADALPALADLLCDAVADGAGVGFLRGLEAAEAEAWWRDSVLAGMHSRRVVLFGAFEGESLLGTVQLRLVQLPNSTHRAEIAKLLVHSAARRRGVGRALLSAAEEAALEMGRTLLILDTVSDSAAEHLYRSAGYVVTGRIAAYALLPEGTPGPATLLHRHLIPARSAGEVGRIRGARVGDAEAMGVIQVGGWKTCYRGAMPDEFLDNLPAGLRESQWRETLTYPRATDRYWILDVEGEVAGFAHTGTSLDRDAVTGSAELFALYVQPERIRMGMGRRLLEHALADVTRRGARWVTAWVFEGADRARHVLEAAGMQLDGAERMFTAAGEPMRELRYRSTVSAGR